ncbi:acyl-CoA dehydrogenase family protein [Tepidiforma flava]|uniref:Acyl-CoA dehydrogenase family protein n=1 Tax=Tepidiforma flava TaxID=3004094 RepID=A0ABY7M8V6_9CHLR|nr:acyl-CoA dehydrogenase family protein [Tepidiforma flava]WBL36935.1 acyl-CoA dehydrogenase family protein [Tepidiforma flava]
MRWWEPEAVIGRDVAELARAEAAEAEARSALTPAQVAAIVERGWFKAWVPREFGGLELDLEAGLRLFEAAGWADGSFGWSVMIGAGGGVFAGLMQEATAHAVFDPKEAVIAGSGNPRGTAERVPGGFRVRGRWQWASGAPWATTFTANCVVTDGGQPVQGANGAPLIRAMAFEPGQVRILSTWDANGMRGTASHDIEVDDAFVPLERMFSVFEGEPWHAGTVFRVPFVEFAEATTAAVLPGIALRLFELVAASAKERGEYGGPRLLAERHDVRARLADALVGIEAGRTLLFDAARQTWAEAERGRPAAATLARLSLGANFAASSALRAAGLLAPIGGMGLNQRASEAGRAWRDLMTAGQHGAIRPTVLAPRGAELLTD